MIVTLLQFQLQNRQAGAAEMCVRVGWSGCGERAGYLFFQCSYSSFERQIRHVQLIVQCRFWRDSGLWT